MYKPWLLLLVLLSGSQVAWALCWAGFRNPAWFDRPGARGGWAWGQEVTTPLCRAAPLTRPCCRDGIGSAGCGKQTWCSDCPVSPCGMRPVCVWVTAEALGMWSVQSFPEGWNDCKQPQARPLNKSQHWDYSEGWKNLSFCAHAAVSSFGQLSQMLMLWGKTLEICLKTSIKLKPEICFLQCITACWGLH